MRGDDHAREREKIFIDGREECKWKETNKQVVVAEVVTGAPTFVAAGMNEVVVKWVVVSLHLSLLLCISGYRCRDSWPCVAPRLCVKGS